MLIDYIPQEKLPWIIVWLDWMVFTYWPSLIISITFFFSHYWFTYQKHILSDIPILITVGICSWIVYCALRYGYAVG